MTKHMPPQAMSLFDLIARSWDLGSDIRQVLFNSDCSTLLSVLADGRLAFIKVRDSEDPDKRMRMELETGRTTIRPREKPLSVPVMSLEPMIADGVAAIARSDKGFGFVHRDSAQIWRATAGGQTLRDAREDGVTGLAALPNGDKLIACSGSLLRLVSTAGEGEGPEVRLGHPVDCLAVSEDGRRVACWGTGTLSILDTVTLDAVKIIACEGEIVSLEWSPDGRWVVGGCADKALLLADVPAGVCDRIVDFPAAPRSVAFSGVAKALIAGGAFRTVGWQLPELPFGDFQGTALETGKPGLTLVEVVAAHPSRNLCASGYANGLVTVCQIGQREELMLRGGGGGTVTSLAWSADGKHLAIGTKDGKAEIVTFPKNMFK